MRRSVKLLLVLLIGAVLASACSKDEPRPIVVGDTAVVVSNLSTEEWRQVEIWLNYYYRVTKPSMAAGERLTIPFNAFVAGYGQRFEVKRQVVQTIEVKAKAFSGAPVNVMFGTGPRK